MTTSDREAHLLDRVRETAKRCIDLGVRVDIPEYWPSSNAEWGAYDDYRDACHAALFQLAEVAGWGEMYTKEDVERAWSDGYDSGRSEGYEAGYEDGVDASAPQ